MSAISYTSTSTSIIMEALRRRESSPEGHSPLIQVFHQLGYITEEQQLGLIKLLAMTETFPVPISSETVLSDEKAKHFLHTLTFSSEKEAFQWLLTATQKNWIRNTSKEGVNQSREANLARWFTSDTEEAAQIKHKLLNIIDTLGFISASPWTLEKSPAAILLNGGLESHIVDRLEALKLAPMPKEGEKMSLCYLTGPRGVFNFEPSLSHILAQWFNDENLIPAFTALLKEYPKDWANGHTLQLQLLLLSIARPEDCPKAEMEKMVAELNSGGDQTAAKQMIDSYWPKGVGCFAKNPEKYDSNQVEGWPVAADLVEYHLNLLKQHSPGVYDHLELRPIVARGKGGRLANTQDTVEQWLLDEGNNLLAHQQQVTVASLSSQPHVVYMNATTHLCLPEGMDVVTLSAEGCADKIQLVTILDVFARYIYTMQPLFAKD